MQLFRKIDTATGNFIEDCLFDVHPILTERILVDVTDEEGIITQVEEIRPVLDAEGETQLNPQYVEEAPPQGFYLPRYLNGVWVEGGVAPEPTPYIPTEADRIGAMEEALDFLLMGGM